MHLYFFRLRYTNCSAYNIDHVDDGYKLSAASRKSNNFSLYSAGGSFCLELQFPKDRAPSNCDNKASSALHTYRIAVLFIIIETTPHGVLTSCSRRIKARLLYIRNFFVPPVRSLTLYTTSTIVHTSAHNFPAIFFNFLSYDRQHDVCYRTYDPICTPMTDNTSLYFNRLLHDVSNTTFVRPISLIAPSIRPYS